MRPIDIYALPAIASEPWFKVHGYIDRIFRDDMIEGDLDWEMARAGGAPPLAFETKLHHPGDGYRSVTIVVAVWESHPFGILVLAGRGGADVMRRAITDMAAYRAARAYVETQRNPASWDAEDFVGPDAHVDELAAVYGHRIVARPDGTAAIVPDSHLDAAGRLLFDESSFTDAFDRLVRPAFPTRNAGPELERGLRGKRMRQAACEIALLAIPEGVTGTIDFSPPPRESGAHGILDWIALLVRTDEGTYGIGISGTGDARGLNWARSMRGERLGDPGLYDTLDRGSAMRSKASGPA